MNTQCNTKPLTDAQVTPNGQDCIMRMLTVDPEKRPKQGELFHHLWLANVPDIFDYSHIEVSDTQNVEGRLKAIHDARNEEELDASQLSLEDDFPDDLEVDELDFGQRNPDGHKHLLSQIRPGSELPITRRLDDPEEELMYPALPSVPSDQAYEAPPQRADLNTDRLFGEIGQSAYRSSGVFGNATGTRDMENPELGSRSLVGSSDTDFTTQVLGHDAAEPSLHPTNYPQHLALPHPATFAPSLHGAEALVGQLNMASPDFTNSAAGTPNTTNPDTPASPDTREGSPSSTTHAKRAAKEPNVAESEHAHKRSRLNHQILDDREHSYVDEAILAPVQERSISMRRGGMTNKGEAEPASTSLPAQLPYAKRAQSVNESTPKAATNDLHGDTTGGPLSGRPKKTWNDVDQLAANDETQAAQCDASVATEGVGFSRPPPRYGRLMSIPGSIVDMKINIEGRITTFGRLPTCTHVWPDPMDIRISSQAIEIGFWSKSGRQEREGWDNWSKFNDIYTTISTASSSCIEVNNVPLYKEDSTPGHECRYYGRLYTGDIVGVYQDPPKKNYLRFRVEIGVGDGVHTRPTDEKPFKILRDEGLPKTFYGGRKRDGSGNRAASELFNREDDRRKEDVEGNTV